MSYEVTKRIKGRDYRYRVESARDPESGRAGTRWIYLGKLENGALVAPVRSVSRRVTHDEIVAVTAKLLESRDASRVTVSVIAHHAGISPGTFYRHFDDRDAAFSAALTALCEQCFDALPALDPPASATPKRGPTASSASTQRWCAIWRSTALPKRARPNAGRQSSR